jgi:hypothetical protein
VTRLSSLQTEEAVSTGFAAFEQKVVDLKQSTSIHQRGDDSHLTTPPADQGRKPGPEATKRRTGSGSDGRRNPR